jgi:AAA ATPase domain
MALATGARFHIDKGCLPGTRRDVMEAIREWFEQASDTNPHILFLCDVAGSGKSHIAHKAAQQYDRRGRLGSSYFFDSTRQAQLSPENLFSTIARDLADHNHEYKRILLDKVGEQRARWATHVPREQFKNLILDPANALNDSRHVLIVIDGLDKSGDPEFRASLLNLLGNETANLPSYLRVLITARPEKDIEEAFRGKSHVRTMSIKEVEDNAAHSIAHFIENQLEHISALAQIWPGGECYHLLANKSEGHFGWASTACRFVKGNGKLTRDPVRRLQRLLSNEFHPLDHLYLSILDTTFAGDDEWKNDPNFEQFQQVLGCILAATLPLSMTTLQKSRTEEGWATAVQDIVALLGAVFIRRTQQSDELGLLHSSFRDFLLNPDRSGDYHIHEQFIF